VPGALVAKTGFTDAAQHTFLGAMSRGGRRLGVVFLRAQRWPSDQWQQARDLMNWGLALPAGTAPVGRLDPPVAAPRPSPAATPGHAAAASLPRLGGRSDTGWLVWLLVFGSVTASGMAWRLRRRVRVK